MSHTDTMHHDAGHKTMTKKTIWVTFFILLAITVLDFAIYFMMPPSMSRNMIFLAFGIVKSYYIVGIFMHMRYEVKRLAMMIVLPMAFILVLIAALLYEGDRWSVIKWLSE